MAHTLKEKTGAEVRTSISHSAWRKERVMRLCPIGRRPVGVCRQTGTVEGQMKRGQVPRVRSVVSGRRDHGGKQDQLNEHSLPGTNQAGKGP
jgi:hypothetical protein